MRIGIIGTGRIAKKFLQEVEFVDEATVTAIYNPHEGSAERFVSEIQDSVVKDMGSAVRGLSLRALPEHFTDLDEMLAKVDGVYIASPHGTHFAYTKAALQKGKHVLCEKPLAFTKKEAKSLFTLAKKNGLVLMEGLKTGYMPGFLHLIEVAKSGEIGEIKHVSAAFTKLVPPDSRELTDGDTAGSFVEMGTHETMAVFSLLGTKYKDVRFDSIRNKKGVDIYTVANFDYGKAFGTAVAGLGVKTEGEMIVAGTNGYIIAKAPWWLTKHFEVHFEDPNRIISYDEDFAGTGMRYEIQHFEKKAQGQDDGVDYENLSVEIAGVMEKFLSGRE